MSRRKCCCKGVSPPDPDDPDPPPPPPGPCSQNPKYVTQSINHGFDYDCNPRGPDGFSYDDWCRSSPPLRDQANDPINDNYLGKHRSFARTQNGLSSFLYFYNSIPINGGNNVAEHEGVLASHYFHVDPNNVFQSGFNLTAECDLGFDRWNRLDKDVAGWFGRQKSLAVPAIGFHSSSPYPKHIYASADLGPFFINLESRDVAHLNTYSLGLPKADAYYETTLSIFNKSLNTSVGQTTFETPLSHFYNLYPTTSIDFVVTDYQIVTPAKNQLTVDFTLTHGGGTLLVEDYVFNAPSCWLDNSLRAYNKGSTLLRLADTGDGSGLNRNSSYLDGLALAAAYPDVAFCFSGMDNFKWNWTV